MTSVIYYMMGLLRHQDHSPTAGRGRGSRVHVLGPRTTTTTDRMLLVHLHTYTDRRTRTIID